MPNRVKSVEKSIIILNALSNQELGISELSKLLGMSKSSVYNTLYTLKNWNLVEKNAVTDKYTLGLRLLELGFAVKSGLRLREIAIPYMQKLIDQTKETANLTIYDSGQIVYIEAAYPEKIVVVSSVIGKRAYMHCTGVGKAIMAYLDEKEIESIIKNHGMPQFTPNTITDIDQLNEELARIRQNGYALDNMEHEYGVKCVAAPIFNDLGKAFASMSLSGPSLRFGRDKIRVYAKMIKDMTKAISCKLGCTTFDNK